MASVKTTIELQVSTFQAFLATTLKPALTFKHGGHGNGVLNNKKVPPPHHPGPRPNYDDCHCNYKTGKATNRRLYDLMQYTEEEVEEARGNGTTLDTYDLGLTPEGAKALERATIAWETKAKDCRHLVLTHNNYDMATTADILALLGPRTIDLLQLHPQYNSLTIPPTDDLIATHTATTLLAIIADTYSAGTITDAATSFQNLLFVKRSKDGLAADLQLLTRNIDESLPQLTNKDGMINPLTIHSLLLMRMMADDTTTGEKKDWVKRFFIKALSEKLDGDQILPSPARLSALAQEELKLSFTIDTDGDDDTESQQGAAYTAQVSATHNPVDKEKTVTSPEQQKREKTNKKHCRHCAAARPDGRLCYGHKEDICTNNPKNAKNAKVQPPVTGNIATAAPSAAATAAQAHKDAIDLAYYRGSHQTMVQFGLQQQDDAPYSSSIAPSVLSDRP
jgi:hypothetical protein